MTHESLETQRADHIYRMGPETLTAHSFAVYAGPVARYSKQVTEPSPPEPGAVPLTWVVSGRLEQPEVLKGQPPRAGAVPFIRQEQTDEIPPRRAVASWERALGHLQAGADAVLFFEGDPSKPVLTVLPDSRSNRAADPGLAALVRDIVGIQSRPGEAAQISAWLAYLRTARSDDARQAALRSLVASKSTDWPLLQPALQTLLASLPPAAGMRSFVTGIVAFGVMQQRWGTQQPDAVDFLCRQFEATQDDGLAVHQLLTLKLVLNHLSDEATAVQRQPLRQRIFQSLKQRAASGPLAPAVQQQYEQIRAAYPGQV